MALSHFFSVPISMIVLLSMVVVIASASGYYENAPKPKPKVENEKPITGYKLLPKTTIGIQGVIYCKSGPKLIPIQGAVSRITCLAVDKYGYESAPFSILSRPTDKKGYFFATLSPSQLEDSWKLTECKAFLESSPLDKCKVSTDTNNGISGALLSSYNFLKAKHIKLYTVGPFIYTSQPKPAIYKGY